MIRYDLLVLFVVSNAACLPKETPSTRTQYNPIMKPAIALCVLALATTAFAQKSDSQMLPDDHQAYHYIWELKRILSGNFVGRISMGPMSRAEAATLTWEILLKAKATFDLSERTEAEASFAWYMGNMWWQVEWMEREFVPELDDMGIDSSVRQEMLRNGRQSLIKERIGVLYSEGYFVDVPPGHWADEAIHNLRRARIIVGYPDGTFRG